MTSTTTLPPEQTKPKLVLTKIWGCKDASCKAWVRDEFADDEAVSACPICKGPVVRSLKHLPEVKTPARRKKAKSTEG
ncbi:cold-inducible protein YdjO-related protein [Paenibacillus thermotolerans]|uniref:cold-inducible protein YdjO-related protein n=1 Tax=Paenibacillus thermotolerans TaxID=3027807 RepID=UPI002368331F|nr:MULTISPECIES: cold-inducible protein YdjO-related protein [unclassified Paenibacillus]